MSETSDNIKVVVNKLGIENDELEENSRERLIKGKNCDVWIVVDGMKIGGHKLVLSTRSVYFRNMFNSGMMEANMNEVSISGIDHQTMELVIKWMYYDRVDLTEDNAQSILLAANYMQMSDLFDRCSKYIVRQIDISNCIAMRHLLKSLNCDKKLINFVTDYINAYFVPLSKHESFVQLDIDDVTQLLSSDSLYIDNEIDVYHAAIRWLDGKKKKKMKKRRKYSERVLQCIRLNLISPADLTIDMSVKNPKNEWSVIMNSHLPSSSSSLPPRECQLIPSQLVQFLPSKGETKSTLNVYDPSTKQWNILKNYPFYPSNSIIVCHQRHIYILGRIETKTPYPRFGRVHLDTGVFESMYGPRFSRYIVIDGDNGSAVVVNNKLYVMNCRYESLKYMDIYDIATNTWSEGKRTREERYYFTIAAIGKYIYACGGKLIGHRESLTSVERFDTETMIWEYVAPMIEARGPISSVAYRGKLYVAGGSNYRNFLQVYDPISDQWSKLAPIRDNQDDTVLVANFDRIYAMRKCMKQMQYYNVATDEWIIDEISDSPFTDPYRNWSISPVFAIPISPHE